MQNLLGPFGDEAVAAFITAIISAIVAYWLHQKSIKRPNIILCEQQSHVHLIRYGLAEVLPFYYDDTAIKSPELVQIRVTNIGTSVIRNPSITLEVNESVKMLRPRLQLIPERKIETPNIWQETPNSITITLDYLNPVRPHNEVVVIDLICDGKIETIKAFGSGEGWSIKYRELSKTIGTAFAYGFIGLFILAVAFIIFIATIISNAYTDPIVSQALAMLWSNAPIRFATLIFIFSVIFVAGLARWAETKSGMLFYKQYHRQL